MKKTITYIIYLLVVSWTIGALLSNFYSADFRLEWGHIYMWSPTILTLLWLIVNNESIKILKWGFKKPWWFYLIAIYIPLIYVLPEIAIQQWSGFISYDFSSLEAFKELGIKIPFSAVIGLGIPVLGEELGWRGYLQSKLVHKLGEIKGILLLGLLWAVWHLPDIMQQEDWLFTAFVFYPLFCISLSFVIYWAMKKCDSIWIAVFIHASNNYIWNAAYSSATINNEDGASILSLLFFLMITGLVMVFLIRKKPAPNKTYKQTDLKTKYSSGGTKKQQLDYANHQIPDSDNLYGIIGTDQSKLDVATSFDNAGWSVRKSSWTDFELECKWAELSLEGENEILINGIIDERKFDDLSRLFNEFGIDYSIELYNSEKEIIKTATNKK